MLKRSFALLALLTIVILTACGGGNGTSSGEVVLKVTGAVGKELNLTDADVKGMDTIDVDYTNKDGETTTYTGVLVSVLLDQAKATGATVAFVADDGYSAEATADEVKGCANCIVGFRDDGSFTMVMPDFSGKLQVKGVVEIQVK